MMDDPLQPQIAQGLGNTLLAPRMDSRQRIAMALQMQRNQQPQGTGILGGLNTALSNGLQMYGMRKMATPAYKPKLPQRDPVMGTGYDTQDPLWNAVDY